MTDVTLTIDYTNHAGVRAIRRVEPLQWRFGTSEWHKDARGELVSQWFMYARDVERNVCRDFALSGIHGFGRNAIPPSQSTNPKAAIPAPGTEERDFWLEAAEQHGFREIDIHGPEGREGAGYRCSDDQLLRLMSEAREQGYKDAQIPIWHVIVCIPQLNINLYIASETEPTHEQIEAAYQALVGSLVTVRPRDWKGPLRDAYPGVGSVNRVEVRRA